MKRISAVIAGIIFLGLVCRPVLGGEKELSLTLEEAVLKAMKNNLGLAVEIYNPDIAEAALAQAREMYIPRLELSSGKQHQESPSYWWLQGTETSLTKYSDFTVTLAQTLPTGGNFSFSLDNYKSDTNQPFQFINPRYGSTMRFDFTQPLLKNFGLRVSRQEILIAQNNMEVSRSQLEVKLLETVYTVQEAYWNLVYSRENLKVKEQSLELGRDLLVKNRREVELGKLAPIEVLNAETVVASREADLLQARALVQRAEDVLRNVINLAAEPEAESLRIVPSDRPDFFQAAVDTEKALETAFAKRPDLHAIRKNLETNELNFSVAKNRLLPGLDFQASYWSPGIAGDRILYLNDDPFTGIIVGSEKGSAADSLRDSLKFLYNNWVVGVTLTIPLNTIFTRAEYARTKLEWEQEQTRLRSLEQQAAMEVRDALRNIQTNAQRVEAYRLTRELAEKRLAAEEKKLEVGLSTNYFVLEFQEELANARSLELLALVDYKLSLAMLDRVTGTALEKHNITLAEAGR